MMHSPNDTLNQRICVSSPCAEIWPSYDSEKEYKFRRKPGTKGFKLPELLWPRLMGIIVLTDILYVRQSEIKKQTWCLINKAEITVGHTVNLQHCYIIQERFMDTDIQYHQNKETL